MSLRLRPKTSKPEALNPVHGSEQNWKSLEPWPYSNYVEFTGVQV